ncbi:MAG: hypothetical protein ACKVQB_11890, partial [Bacteroidia bacterium]
MKKSIRLKSLTLLLLLAVSIFPFQIFCHQDNSEEYKTISISKESSHHDCPFCSFQFCNEFEQTDGFLIQSNEFSLNTIVLNFEKEPIKVS